MSEAGLPVGRVVATQPSPDVNGGERYGSAIETEIYGQVRSEWTLLRSCYAPLFSGSPGKSGKVWESLEKSGEVS